jgi:hypothetical protein
MKEIFPRRNAAFFALVGFLTLPSIGEVQKYLGNGGVAVYLIIAPLALGMFYHYVVPWLAACVTERKALLLAAFTWLGLVGLFAVLYPIADSGVIGGGSDQDDSLNITVSELLHGRYPYYPRTYLGGAASILPGAVLLGIPFFLIGNCAYESLVWLGAYFLIARSYLRDSFLALVLMWTILAFSPSVMEQIVTGGDHPANTIYVLAFTLGVVNYVPRSDVRQWTKLLLSGLLGVGLSSRGNFVFLLPLIFSQLAQATDWRTATKYLAVTCLAFAAITLPFWLYDPGGFTPLSEEWGTIDDFGTWVPYSGFVICGLTGIAALLLSLQRMDSSHVALLRNCALVQASPVVFVVVLSSILAGRLSLMSAGYGQFSLFFGVLAASIMIGWTGTDSAKKQAELRNQRIGDMQKRLHERLLSPA